MSTSITPSGAGLRALSHPTRLKMLMLLRLEGPATATQLAGKLSLNTGATSYHLRQLAEHGFIEEDAERGDGRDRWWRSAHQSTRVGMAARPEEEAEDAQAYLQTVALMYTETLMQAVAERRFLPAAWQEASTTSDWHIRLTPARAKELLDGLEGVISRFWDTEEPRDSQGAAVFVVNLNAFPRPGTVVLEDEDA